MRRIVVGFDGTAPSQIALEWASFRAAARGYDVHIVQIIPPELTSERASIALDLQDAELYVRNRAPRSAATSSVVDGRLPDALVESAAYGDLLVIGAHRDRPIRAALTGWLPFQIASTTTVPTVVVPGDWSGSDGAVVVGVDDDDTSRSAVLFAADEAIAAGRPLTLVHAWHAHSPTMEGTSAVLSPMIDTKTDHRRMLDEVYARTGAARPGARIDKILLQDDAASAVLSVSARASMLVLGTHHDPPFNAAVLGSVSRTALADSRAPVCVVPDSGDAS